MAQFIDPLNQERLWKAFHRIPGVSTLTAREQENLFKSCIGDIYDQHNGAFRKEALSRDELQGWNKRTVDLFLTHLRAPKAPSSPVGAPKAPYAHEPGPTRAPKAPYSHEPTPIGAPSAPYASEPTLNLVETEYEKTNRIFEEKQKQYDQMTAKPNVPKPSELFQESSPLNDDGVITNMDELIEQYQTQRQLDVPIVETSSAPSALPGPSALPAPSAPSALPGPSAPLVLNPETTEIATIHETLGKIQTLLQSLESRMDAIESQFHLSTPFGTEGDT